jgi:uncharacterized protein
MSMNPLGRPRDNALTTLFGNRRAVVGVIHLLPLPGSPDYNGESMEK